MGMDSEDAKNGVRRAEGRSCYNCERKEEIESSSKGKTVGGVTKTVCPYNKSISCRRLDERNGIKSKGGINPKKDKNSKISTNLDPGWAGTSGGVRGTRTHPSQTA